VAEDALEHRRPDRDRRDQDDQEDAARDSEAVALETRPEQP